jgi:hypothetical protein
MEETAAALSLRAAVVARLEDLEETTVMRIALVNVLTGNSAGWLETVPAFARRFAGSVFSDQSAKELPPSRQISTAPSACATKKNTLPANCTTCPKSKICSRIWSMIKIGCYGQGGPKRDPGPSRGTKRRGWWAESKQGRCRKSRGAPRNLWTNSSAKDSSVLQPGQLVACLLRRGQGLPLPGVNQMRLVMDYRDLNSNIYLDEHSLPAIRTVISGPSSLPEKARARLTGCIGF